MKAIFIALVIFVISSSVGVCRGFCVDFQNHIVGAKTQLVDAVGDLCSDCGHTKTCCSNSYSSGVPSLTFAVDFFACVCHLVSYTDNEERSFRKIQNQSKGTRAPPLLKALTSYTLFQRLQV
jgi:hypothetical protein